MSTKFNKVCLICGKQYEYCNSCAKDAKKPEYLNMFCSEDCDGIYTTIVKYLRKDISKDEAKNDLISFNALDKNLKEQYKKHLDEIYEGGKVSEIAKEVFESEFEESSELIDKDEVVLLDETAEDIIIETIEEVAEDEAEEIDININEDNSVNFKQNKRKNKKR